MVKFVKKMKMWKLQTDTAVSAAILCLAVWVCDINKAGMGGTSVFYDMGKSFSELHWQRAWHSEEIKFEAEKERKKWFCCININQTAI